jgi:hypothetical protein
MTGFDSGLFCLGKEQILRSSFSLDKLETIRTFLIEEGVEKKSLSLVI